MDQNEAVVDLSDYRRKRSTQELPRADHDDNEQLIADIAYYLLKAIQAVKQLTH